MIYWIVLCFRMFLMFISSWFLQASSIQTLRKGRALAVPTKTNSPSMLAGNHQVAASLLVELTVPFNPWRASLQSKLKQIQRLGSPKAGPLIYEGRVEWGQSWLRLRAKWLGSKARSSSSQGPQSEDKYSKTPCIHAMRFEMLKNSDWPRSCCAPWGGPAKGLPIILAKKASKPERVYFKELWPFCHAHWCRLTLLACLICISTSRVQHEFDALVENKMGHDRGTFVVMSASAVSRHYGSTAVPPHDESKIKLEHLHIKQ